MSGKRSTPNVRARAVQRYREGDPIDEIAAEAQVTPASVMVWARRAAGLWLGERHPDLLLATMKYAAAVATAMSADGKRSQ